MHAWQQLWADLETWERLYHVCHPWASFNSCSQLPACLYSFHLTVLFRQPFVPMWPYSGPSTYSGDLFSRWLTPKRSSLVIPKCFPCVQGGVAIVGTLGVPTGCMSVMLGVKSKLGGVGFFNRWRDTLGSGRTGSATTLNVCLRSILNETKWRRQAVGIQYQSICGFGEIDTFTGRYSPTLLPCQQA